MCIIIGIVKNKNSNSLVMESIKNAVIEAQKSNAHGSAMVAWKGKSVSYQRTMKMKEADIEKYIFENNRIVFHFRIATAGSVRLDNCHLWEKEKWYYAHNGFASARSKTDRPDSYEVMEKIWEKKAVSEDKVNLKLVKGVYRKCNLTGKTIFVKPELDKMVMTGDYNVYGLDNSILIFASGRLDFSEKKKIFGFEFGIEDYLKGEMDGVNLFNGKGLKKIMDDDLSGYAGYGGYSCNYKGYYDDENPEPIYSPHQKRLFTRTIDQTETEMISEPEDEDYEKMVANEVEEVVRQQERAATREGVWKVL